MLTTGGICLIRCAPECRALALTTAQHLHSASCVPSPGMTPGIGRALNKNVTHSLFNPMRNFKRPLSAECFKFIFFYLMSKHYLSLPGLHDTPLLTGREGVDVRVEPLTHWLLAQSANTGDLMASWAHLQEELASLSLLNSGRPHSSGYESASFSGCSSRTSDGHFSHPYPHGQDSSQGWEPGQTASGKLCLEHICGCKIWFCQA